MNQTSLFCPQCRQPRLFLQQTPNHILHLLVSVFLCGLWLPVWFLIAVTNDAPFLCSICGTASRRISPAQATSPSAFTVWLSQGNNKRTLAGGSIAAIVIIALLAIFSAYSENKAREKRNVELETANRRAFIQDVRSIYRSSYPDLKAETSGDRSEILLIRHEKIDERFSTVLQSNGSVIMQKIKQKGFKAIHISNGRQDWQIDIHD